MKAQHTPGPWLTRTGFMENGIDVYPKNDEIKPPFKPTALATVSDSYDEEAEANARLIAAAPDLLALLIELVDMEGPQPGTSAWGDKVRAAIAKTTGGAA